jgi:hypothetical protein
LTLAAILRPVIFGFDWPVALAIIIVGALAVYWVLVTFSRRRGG